MNKYKILIIVAILACYVVIYVISPKTTFGVPAGILSMVVRLFSMALLAWLLTKELCKNATIKRVRVLMIASSVMISIALCVLIEAAVLAISWKIM